MERTTWSGVFNPDGGRRDPLLLNPAEMAAWRFFDFCSDYESWRQAAVLKAEMKKAYAESTSKASTALDYFHASARPLMSGRVASALAAFTVTHDFRLSVANPDTSEEFYAEPNPVE